MPGKKPLKKLWDKPRKLRSINPSKYEQNEPSVKVYWKNVAQELELSYKDEKFWETSADKVKELVSPMVYYRLTQMFSLKPQLERHASDYRELDSVVPSEHYYTHLTAVSAESPSKLKAKSSEPVSATSVEMEQVEVEEEHQSDVTVWSLTTSEEGQKTRSSSKSAATLISKSISKMNFSRQMTNFSRFNRSGLKVASRPTVPSLLSESAETHDDVLVHHGGYKTTLKESKNPHFTMLYCNESETDMIKWDSHYKQKTFEVSASDEFSKKAEIKTKQIAKDFFDWWTNLGTVEFRSEIRRPEDIEGLFQVWFDEHASRSLAVDMRELPCVLRHIADHVGLPDSSCDKVLKRQIKYDMQAELEPAHTGAFGAALPHKMKHIPPRNDTVTLWRAVAVPADLRSMACVWGDILHLTSTKSFRAWLKQHPHMPTPPVFASQLDLTSGAGGQQQARFVVPSDFVLQSASRRQSGSKQELALPVSQFNLDMKEVLEKIMNE